MLILLLPEVNMPSHSDEWKKIAEQLISEPDPKKVIELAEKLTAALDRGFEPGVTPDNPAEAA
jgi:hypothetical protein